MITERDGQMWVEWTMACDPYQKCYISLNDYLFLVKHTTTEEEFRARLWNMVQINDDSKRLKQNKQMSSWRARVRQEARERRAAAAAAGGEAKAKMKGEVASI